MTRFAACPPCRIRHESRLAFREMQLDFGPALLFLSTNVVAAVYLGLHLLAYLGLVFFRMQPGLPPWLLDAVVLGAVCFLATVRATATAYRMLVERRDGAVIATAPVDLRLMLRARATALAASSITLPMFWFSPLATVRLLSGETSALAFYPATLAIGMITAAGALSVLLTVTRFVGKARMQSIARLALLGLLFGFIVLQSTGAEMQAALAAYWLPRTTPVFATLAGVMAGQPAPLLAVLGLGGLAFLLAPRLLARGFAVSLMPARRVSRVPASFGADSSAPATWRDSRALRLMRKEWRLLWRDHTFLGQIFVSLLLTIAALALLLTRQHIGAEAIAAAGIVYAAGNLCSDLTWLTVSGEQAPSLLRSAPLSAPLLMTHKMLAALLPVAALLLLATVILALVAPFAAAQALVFGTLASATAAAMNLAWPTPGDRGSAVFERRSKNRALALLDAGCLMCWALATATPLAHPGMKGALALAPLLLVSALLAARTRLGWAGAAR